MRLGAGLAIGLIVAVDLAAARNAASQQFLSHEIERELGVVTPCRW